MKKLILLFVCLAGMVSVNAQTTKIALQHNGNVTLFDADQMEAALNASADGDTLYLNEGTFIGNVTIAKKVAIIGAGENTRINGSITISIPGTPTLTSHLLDALNISSNIIISQSLNGLKIRKCQFSGISFNAKTEDVVIDRCYSYGSYFTLSSNIKKMTVINSKIYKLTGEAEYAGDVYFINCNIYEVYNYNSSGLATYVNSIIRSWSYSNSSYHDSSTTYVNCLCGQKYYVYSVNQNCWNYGNTNILDNKANCALTDDELRSKGYIGDDGTVAGITGGTTPFSLVPSTPKVSDYTIKVDTQTKKLNVNIKVTAN